MAAPNLTTLLDFETNVEDAAQVFLASATGLAATNVNASLDQDDLELPRLEVSFELGEALDPPDPKLAGSGELEYRKYSGTLNVMIMTRGSLDGSQTAHREYRAEVREALLLNAQNFTLQYLFQASSADAVPAIDGLKFYDSGTLSGGKTLLLSEKTDAITEEQYQIVFDSNLSVWGITRKGKDGDSGGWVKLSGATAPGTYDFTVGGFTGSVDIAAISEDPVLPYYDVNYLRPTGTQYEVEGDVAMSALSFQMNLAIRNDAWPS